MKTKRAAIYVRVSTVEQGSMSVIAMFRRQSHFCSKVSLREAFSNDPRGLCRMRCSYSRKH
jgi:hypothetical protein